MAPLNIQRHAHLYDKIKCQKYPTTLRKQPYI